MENGYYLSTFLAFDELAYMKEVKLRHDQNVSLWKKAGNNISIIKYWELERITGFKQHSETFKDRQTVEDLLNMLLKQERLSVGDMKEIWGTSGLERECKFYHDADVSFHSITHIFSSIFMNGSDYFYKNSIVALAADCGPDNLWEEDAFARNFYAGAVSINGKIEYFPISSPGYLWSHAKKRLGLREGTLMALATASPCRFTENQPAAFAEKDITNRDLWPEMSDYVDALIEKAKILVDAHDDTLVSGFDARFTKEENIASMVMKEVQLISNEIMAKNVDAILKKYGLDPKATTLALSGGFCLNCPSNSYLMNKFGFQELLIPPVTSDCGISLGQALYYFYYENDGQIEIGPISPYLGEEFKDFSQELETHKVYFESVSEFDESTFVQDIVDHPIIWFNGRSEIGPRSLGNRSILSDPRTLEMKDKLNTLKRREWWRPVAPVVLEEKMGICFGVEKRSPFMLELIEVKPEMLPRIPAVCHLDTTARIQTIQEADNPDLHRAISAFYKETGIPLLCNTSLNDNNEPIINAPEEALNFCLRKGIKVAYMNGLRLKLHNHDLFDQDYPKERDKSFNKRSEQVDCPQRNPYGLSKDEVTVFWDYKYEYGGDALLNKEKAGEIKEKTDQIKARYKYLAR